MSLYFGPFNDPVDTGVSNHSINPHPPDFHNAAFTLTRSTNSDQSVALSISVAVRNTDTLVATADSVKLYAAACGILSTAADVNQLAATVLTNIGTPLQQWLLVDVPPRSASGDTFWLSPAPVLWTVPPYASGFIVIATLQMGTQTPGTNYAGDPSVAIWLG